MKLDEVDDKACIYVAGDMKRNRFRKGYLSYLEKTDEGKLIFGRGNDMISDFWKDQVPLALSANGTVCTVADLKRSLVGNPEHLEISRYGGSNKSVISSGFFKTQPEGEWASHTGLGSSGIIRKLTTTPYNRL